jgi:hypothetical protein
VAIQWTLDLLFSRQIEQFVTLRDIEQIELLAAQLRTARLVTTAGGTLAALEEANPVRV